MSDQRDVEVRVQPPMMAPRKKTSPFGVKRVQEKPTIAPGTVITVNSITR